MSSPRVMEKPRGMWTNQHSCVWWGNTAWDRTKSSTSLQGNEPLSVHTEILARVTALATELCTSYREIAGRPPNVWIRVIQMGHYTGCISIWWSRQDIMIHILELFLELPWESSIAWSCDPQGSGEVLKQRSGNFVERKKPQVAFAGKHLWKQAGL